MGLAILVRRNQRIEGMDKQAPLASGRKPVPVPILGAVGIAIGRGTILNSWNDYHRIPGDADRHYLRHIDRCRRIHSEAPQLQQAIYTVKHSFARAACNHEVAFCRIQGKAIFFELFEINIPRGRISGLSKEEGRGAPVVRFLLYRQIRMHEPIYIMLQLLRRLLFHRICLVGDNNLVPCQLPDTYFLVFRGFSGRSQCGVRQKGKSSCDEAGAL